MRRRWDSSEPLWPSASRTRASTSAARSCATQKHAAGSLDERYPESDEGSPYDAAIARFSREREELDADALADEQRLLEQTELVAWALAQIDNDNYREVLELTLLERLAGDEIAARLNITPDNVYARRSRGMKQLEKILGDHGS